MLKQIIVLPAVDWLVVAGYVGAIVLIGVWQKRRAQGKVDDFFVSGRKLPWWIAGTSMIAASFASDTPLLVSGLVRQHGIWRNWMWWGSAISLILTVFFFSRLWRRSMVLTEVELTELRYTGKPAAALRGFKAVYWGLLYNCFVAGAWSVTGLSKVLQQATGLNPVWAIVVCTAIAGIYSILSGFWGVVATDCFQFILAIFGAVTCAYVAVQAAGGWDAMIAGVPAQKMEFIPGKGEMFTWFLSFVLVQWWAWKNTDGGGLLVQRMAACKNERHAVYATLWYSLFHFAIRCWPWIVVALASIVLIPDSDLLVNGKPDHEMAYARVIVTVVPAGLKGLLIGWFLAEFMSSINTHTNWGSSMLVNDFYRRFWRKKESEGHYVNAGRVATVIVMFGAMGCAFLTGDIAKSFEYVLQGTAAIGVVAALRWLWWRINVWTEVVVMVLSPLTTFVLHPMLIVPRVLPLLHLPDNRIVTLVSIVLVSCIPALIVTFLTKPDSDEKLREFYKRVRPPGPGWARIAAMCPGVRSDMRLLKLLGLWVLGVATVFGTMYSAYAILFGKPYGYPMAAASVLMLVGILTAARNIEDVGAPPATSSQAG